MITAKKEDDERRKRPSGGENPDDSSSKRAKFERTFVSSWLEKYDWLRYDSNSNLMFCVLCIKYQKSNAFTEGCQNFRRDNLNKHVNTNDHKASCRQEKGEVIAPRPPSACSLGNSSTSSAPSSGSSVASADASAELNQTSHSCSSESSPTEDAPRSPVPPSTNAFSINSLNVVPLPPQAVPVSSNAFVTNRDPAQISSPLCIKEPLPFYGHSSPHLPLSMPFFPRPPFPYSPYAKPLSTCIILLHSICSLCLLSYFLCHFALLGLVVLLHVLNGD